MLLFEDDRLPPTTGPAGRPGWLPGRGRINKEVNAALADPMIKARFADLGATVFPSSPAEFGRFIADEP
jgi:hypothetical protein